VKKSPIPVQPLAKNQVTKYEGRARPKFLGSSSFAEEKEAVHLFVIQSHAEILGEYPQLPLASSPTDKALTDPIGKNNEERKNGPWYSYRV